MPQRLRIRYQPWILHLDSLVGDAAGVGIKERFQLSLLLNLLSSKPGMAWDYKNIKLVLRGQFRRRPGGPRSQSRVLLEGKGG
jgi:hypothetical protein